MTFKNDERQKHGNFTYFKECVLTFDMKATKERSPLNGLLYFCREVCVWRIL